jgi:hypothetical protein
MARLLSFLASAAVISSLLFRAVTPAAACTCAQTTLDELVASTSIIAMGGVTTFWDPPLDPNSPDTVEHRLRVRFQVEEYLKGGGPQELVLVTGTTRTGNTEGSNSCEMLGEGLVGRRYVLFIEPAVDNTRAPGSCSGSFSLDVPSAEDYVLQIRAILQATPTPAPSPAPTAAPTASPAIGLPRTGGAGANGSSHLLVIGVAAAGALALAGGALLRRRYR